MSSIGKNKNSKDIELTSGHNAVVHGLSGDQGPRIMIILQRRNTDSDRSIIHLGLHGIGVVRQKGLSDLF